MRICYSLLLTWILLSKTSQGAQWNVKCRFNDTDQNVFWTGQSIAGVVELVNTNTPYLQLERIDAELIGELSYTTTRSHLIDTTTWTNRTNNTSNATTHSSTEKVTIRETFFTERVLVHPLHKKGKFPVRYGSRSWPFRFKLARNLPPSMDENDNDIPVIRYYIRFTFVRSEWYKTNERHTFPIIVKLLPSLSSSSKQQDEKSSRKGVRLRVTLEENAAATGSALTFDLNLDNPQGALIRGVSVALVQTVKLGSTERKVTVVKRDLEEIENRKYNRFNGNFQVQIPHNIPATFSYRFSSNSTKQSIGVHYELISEVYLRGFFTNIQLELPVTITNGVPDTDDDE